MNIPSFPHPGPFAQELDVAFEAARRAAGVIMRFYDEHTAQTYTKGDGSPVTDADLEADRTIRKVITAAFPHDGLLTEEGEAGSSGTARRLWIVDPIDGTAEFLAGTGKFDVLIALAVDRVPRVALTMQPTTGVAHGAISGRGAWRRRNDVWQPLRLAPPASPPRLAGSNYYLLPGQEAALAGVTAALRAEPPMMLDVGFQPRAMDDSERRYDVFIGMPQDPDGLIAREWDIAASDLIMHEAGGALTDVWGRRHRYGKRVSRIVGGVVASASPELHDRVIAALAPHLPGEGPDPDPEDARGGNQ